MVAYIWDQKIDKRHIEATIFFAINYVPDNCHYSLLTLAELLDTDVPQINLDFRILMEDMIH